MIKEIIMFCYGDSSQTSTWSNVPYMMSRQLERRGVTIHRVNIAPNKYISKVYNLAMSRLFRRKGYTYIRTALFKFFTELRIKHAVKRHNLSDFCIFLNFDYYNKFSNIPSLCFSDWTYEKFLLERINNADIRDCDKRFIEQQNDVFRHAEIILPLFSESIDDILRHVPSAKVKSIKENVVNNLYSGNVDESVIHAKKRKTILFIGGPKYKQGLMLLIESLKLVAREKDIELNVIGMTSCEMSEVTFPIKYHGYLKKDDTQQCLLYYSLLLESSILINPTPYWGAYSSIIEGMYFYTPIIVSPYKQFILEFGENIDFGLYTDSTTADLSKKINYLLDLSPEAYAEICRNAHNRVKDYTWDNYVNKMISIMEQYKNT